MINDQQGIFFFFEWLDLLEDLDPAEAMEVIRNLHHFMADGTEPPENQGSGRALQKIIMAHLRRRVVLSERGRKGGLASTRRRALLQGESEGLPIGANSGQASSSTPPPPLPEEGWIAMMLSDGREEWDARVQAERKAALPEARP